MWVGIHPDAVRQIEAECRVKTRPAGGSGLCGSDFSPTMNFKKTVGLKPDPQGAVWVGLQPGHGATEPAVREGLLAAAPAIGCCAVTCRRRQSDNELQKNCRVKTRPTEGSGFCGSGFIPTRSGKLKRNVGLKPDPRGRACCNCATHPLNTLTPHQPLG